MLSWPGSLAENSEKSKHWPDQGISFSVMLGLRKAEACNGTGQIVLSEGTSN